MSSNDVFTFLTSASSGEDTEMWSEGSYEVLIKIFTFIISYLIYLLIMGIAVSLWDKVKKPTEQFVRGNLLSCSDGNTHEESKRVVTDAPTDIQTDAQTTMARNIDVDGEQSTDKQHDTDTDADSMQSDSVNSDDEGEFGTFDDFSVYGIAESFVQDTITKAVEQCQLEQQIKA